MKFVKTAFSVNFGVFKGQLNSVRKILKNLEKKNQNSEGSVIDKLCNAGYFIKEYNSCLNETLNATFTVEYSFCLSQFLKDKYTSNSSKFNVE